MAGSCYPAGRRRSTVSGTRSASSPTADDALDTAALRAIPLGRIIRALNSPRRREWVRQGGQEPSPQLQELLAATDEPKPPVDAEVAPPGLQRPPRGRGGGDDFYRQVAEAYHHHAQRSHRPAVEIAQQAGVPPATARRWIEQARVRGFLVREGRKSN